MIFLIVLALNRGIRKVFTIPTWGNDNVHIKTQYILENEQDVNTVFIGSSTVYRHLNPSVFDSEMPEEYGIRSFNLGSGRFAPPESYIYYKYLLSQKTNVKYAFIELRDIFNILDENLHTARANYWYTPSYFLFTIRAILNNKSLRNKEETNRKIRNHSLSFIENLLNVGLFKAVIRQKIKENRLVSRNLNEVLGEENNGFKGYYVERKKKQNKENAQSDTTRMAKKMDQVARKFGKYERKNFDCNQVHLKEIEELIRFSDEKGVHLVFFLNPKIAVRKYEEFIPIMQHIDNVHILELADSRKYPQLYAAKYAYDNSHLNVKGAELISKLAANKFTAILSEIENK